MAANSSGNSDSWDFVFLAESITKSSESPSSRSTAYAHISLLSFSGSFCVETRPNVLSFCHFGMGLRAAWTSGARHERSLPVLETSHGQTSLPMPPENDPKFHVDRTTSLR